jgi:hypothetical protein
LLLDQIHTVFNCTDFTLKLDKFFADSIFWVYELTHVGGCNFFSSWVLGN